MTNIIDKSDAKCIIHQSSFSNDHLCLKLIPLRDFDSWKTLLVATKVRRYAPVLEAAETVTEQTLPNVFMTNIAVLGVFTLKGVLDSLKCKDEQHEHLKETVPEKKTLVLKGPPQVQEYTRRNACSVKRLNTRNEPIPERT
jgi:hypothetical protein